MGTNVYQQKIAAPEFKVRRGTVKCESGLTLTKMATAIFDTATNDSSAVSNKTVAAHGLGVFLPIGAIVIRSFYQVKTTFTSATSAATIALKVTGTGDLVAAIAINDGSNPWNSGLHGALAGNYAEATVAGDTAILAAARAAGSYIGPLSAEKELTATVAVEALTAGKLALFVEYVQGL